MVQVATVTLEHEAHGKMVRMRRRWVLRPQGSLIYDNSHNYEARLLDELNKLGVERGTRCLVAQSPERPPAIDDVLAVITVVSESAMSSMNPPE